MMWIIKGNYKKVFRQETELEVARFSGTSTYFEIIKGEKRKRIQGKQRGIERRK